MVTRIKSNMKNKLMPMWRTAGRQVKRCITVAMIRLTWKKGQCRMLHWPFDVHWESGQISSDYYISITFLFRPYFRESLYSWVRKSVILSAIFSGLKNRPLIHFVNFIDENVKMGYFFVVSEVKLYSKALLKHGGVWGRGLLMMLILCKSSTPMK